MGHIDYAPNFFLVIHDPFTGRLEASRELAQCGLVAAELAHLIVERRLGITDERVVVVEEPGFADASAAPEVPDDAAGAEIDDYVVSTVRQQASTHPVRVWAEVLGDIVYGLLADQLVEQGVLRRERRKLVARRSGDRLPAADLLKASGPRVMLDGMVREPRTVTLAGAVTLGLLDALGLLGLLDTEPSRAYLDELAQHQPTQIRHLMAGTAKAASAVSLTIRR